MAVWGHSFLVLPAVGFFKHDIQISDTEYQQHTNIQLQGARYNPPCGTSVIPTHCVGHV
jgi:hypothetical protein